MNVFIGKAWITLFLTWLFISKLMTCWYVKCQLKYFYFKGSSQKILSLPRFVNLLSIPVNWELLIFSKKKKQFVTYIFFSSIEEIGCKKPSHARHVPSKPVTRLLYIYYTARFNSSSSNNHCISNSSESRITNAD